MSSRVPAETVVTVWVYPDSFGEFRKLKSALYREGFLAAARPLPPIFSSVPVPAAAAAPPNSDRWWSATRPDAGSRPASIG